MNELRSVVLTGFGVITAQGDVTSQNPGRILTADTPETAGRALENFKIEDYLTSQKTYLDRCTALALAGCALALRDAGVEWPVTEHGFEANAFGLTMGTHLGCIETMKGFWDKAMEKGVRVAPPLLFSHSYFNTPISLCAIEFGLKGYHTTFCSGHASGLDSIRAAYDAIRLGHATIMLAGGVEALTPTRTQCEAAIENSTPLGEAATFFVLEDAASAQRRKAPSATEINDSLLNGGR